MLDPGLSFERFVVGAANELAATAAKRAAESPGGVYNPLLICGRGGVGKTHLLHAIGEYATALEPDIAVHIESADLIAHRVSQGIASGDLRPVIQVFTGLDLLLIDEIERLSGMQRTQQELAAIAVVMADEGRQLVMSSELTPSELPGLIPEFRDLLGRGLVVEIAPPDEMLRWAIAERLAKDRGLVLPERVLRSLAACEFPDIRSVRKAVAGMIDIARAEDREVRTADVFRVLEEGGGSQATGDEFGSFVDDVSRTLAVIVETAPWRRRIAEAILKWEGEGIRTNRLEEVMLTDSPPDVETLLGDFSRNATRLLQIRQELRALGVHDPVDDPSEVERAEAKLAETLRAKPAGRSNGASPDSQSPPGSHPDPWFLNGSKVVLAWTDLEGRLVENPR